MNAVTFSGSNYLVGQPPFASGPFGRGIFSYFYEGTANQTGTILAGTDGLGNIVAFEHQLVAEEMRLRVYLQGNSGSQGLCAFRSVDPIPHDGRWFGIVVAWNTLAPGGIVSARSGTNTLALQQVEGIESAGFSINPAAISWTVGRGFRGCLSEVWFLGGGSDYTDIIATEALGPLLLEESEGDDPATARKGNDGQVPLGSVAQIYLHGPASMFANNHGGGSAFSRNGGGLVDCPDGPAPRMSAVQVALRSPAAALGFIGNMLTRQRNAIMIGLTRAVRG